MTTLPRVFVLLALSMVLMACGASSNQPPLNGSSDSAIQLEEEKRIVQEAMRAYMKRTGVTEIPARTKPRQIGPVDVNVPFKGELQMTLPTMFKYAWDERGNVTEASSE